MPVLELLSPKAQVIRSLPYEQDRVIVGRADDCFLIIKDDDQISRHHCEVVRHKGRYILHDLNSRNGTVVGNRKVEAVKLRTGGVFRAGNSYVRFWEEAPVVAQGDAAGKQQTAANEQASNDESVYDVAVLAEDDDEPLTNSRGPAAARGGNAYGADSLQSLATIGADPGFGLNKLSLINARSQIVHRAGEEASGQGESLLVLQLILMGAIRTRATDVHLEPRGDDALLRMRIDGAMIEVCSIPVELAKKTASLCKVLCDIDIAQRAIIQEGHFALGVPGRRIDYRVSLTPVMHGQKMVIRVLDKALSPQTLSDMGLTGDVAERLVATSEQSTGLVTICGPTGSGKTTTLYAILRGIDAQLRNVITIEDPIEYELPSVTQIPVDADKGHGFAQLLRSCLRQDPDVIVVGEIRDRDTAITGLQAATTGHLVLSTIHATDTIGTVFRLLDLGVEPYLVASTLNLVLAQRLVRTLCDECKRPIDITPRDLRRMNTEDEPDTPIYGPQGCDLCFNTGYAGRTAAFELLTANDRIRDVILATPNIADLKAAAMDSGFTSLRDHARSLILEGKTSIDECHRVIGLE
ncbi:MAG: ATPase, T2SS/T4P/T4SS family [Planctomycetota bacterium]